MFKSSYKLGTAFGIPIYLDFSVILLALYMVYLYGSLHEGVAGAILLLLSITLHELGHSVVAQLFGCHVRDITLMIIGGRATLTTMPRKHWQELLVAAAGPAVSLILALIGTIVPLMLNKAGLLNNALTHFIIYSLGIINLMLFSFNLLPAFPMDGGRILRAALQMRMTKLRATWIATRIGRTLSGLMIFFAICNILHIRLPTPPLPGLPGQIFWHFISSGGFIKLLIGWMLFNAAEREYRQVLAESQYQQQRPRNPFSGFPFSRQPPPPPADDNYVEVSPPPYAPRQRSSHIELERDN